MKLCGEFLMSVVENACGAASLDGRCRGKDFEILNAIFSEVLRENERDSASQALLNRFGNAVDVLVAGDDELDDVSHVPKSALQELKRTRRLMQMIMKSEILDRPLLDNLDDVSRFGRSILAGKTREELHAIFLDGSYYLLGHECLQVGTVNHVAVYPRELMGRALRKNASHIILIHNHPGGTEQPSKSDIEMTRVLIRAGEPLNITILDHIIIGRNTDFSFRKNGLMKLD